MIIVWRIKVALSARLQQLTVPRRNRCMMAGRERESRVRCYHPGHRNSLAIVTAFAAQGLPWHMLGFSVLALPICLSLAYAGMHFVTDILAGAVTGILVGVAVRCLYVIPPSRTNSPRGYYEAKPQYLYSLPKPLMAPAGIVSWVPESFFLCLKGNLRRTRS